MEYRTQVETFPEGRNSRRVVTVHWQGESVSRLPSIRTPLPLVRNAFLQYHLRLRQTKRELAAVGENSMRVLQIGKRWWWMAKRHPMGTVVYSNNIARPVLEAFEAAERLALMHFLLDLYLSKQRELIPRVTGETRGIDATAQCIRKATMGRLRLRQFMEQKGSLIFCVVPFVGGGTTAPLLREELLRQIAEFNHSLSQMTEFSLGGRRGRAFRIALYQEMTNASCHTSIRYLESLGEASPFVMVECGVSEGGVRVEVEVVVECLKAPLLALSSLPLEDQQKAMAEVTKMVTRWLHSSCIIGHPSVGVFGSLLGPLRPPSSFQLLLQSLASTKRLLLRLRRAPLTIHSGIFIVGLSSVWAALAKKGKEFVHLLQKNLKESFNESIDSLLVDFRRFDRLLFFRSIVPELMLHNKAQVDKIKKEDIGESIQRLVQVYDDIFLLTQHQQLDAMQHETLLSIVSLRLSLPQLITDHNLFFQKRMHSLVIFVQRRQAALAASSTRLLDKASVTAQFVNPHESEQYLLQLKPLQPVVVDLCATLDAINEYESVVGMPLTEIPRIRTLDGDLTLMEELFICAIGYYNHVNAFFDERRVNVVVADSEAVVVSVLTRLSNCEARAGQQRSIRHFILQVRNDVDKFKKNFPVVETMSCKRFVERHWTKISEIVGEEEGEEEGKEKDKGVDMSLHANSTVATICELGLEDHLNQLRPVAISAEREAELADSAEGVVSFWSSAVVEWEGAGPFRLLLPSNLPLLLHRAHQDILCLTDCVNSEHSPNKKTLSTWLSTLSSVHSILSEWNAGVSLWKGLCLLLHHNRSQLEWEYSLFRRCAKYWQRLERRGRDEASAIRLLDGGHAPCWISHAALHLHSVVDRLSSLFHDIKVSAPRLALSSSSTLVSLLATRDLLCLIETLREAFPLLESLKVEGEDLVATTRMGETLVVENVASGLQGLGVVSLVQALEECISSGIVAELSRDRRETSLGRTASCLLEWMSSSTSTVVYSLTKEGEVVVGVRGGEGKTKATISLGSGSSRPSPSASILLPWSGGRTPLLVGSTVRTRGVARGLASLLLCPPLFVSAHFLLSSRALRTLSQSSPNHSVLIVLENVQFLSQENLTELFTALSLLENQAFKRLVLTSTSPIDHPECIVIHSVPATASFLSTDFYTPESTDHLRHSVLTGTVSAVIGPQAKDLLSQSLPPDSTRWLYVDAFTDSQLLREGKIFASASEGVLSSLLIPSSPSPPLPSSTPPSAGGRRRSSAIRVPSSFVVLFCNWTLADRLSLFLSLLQRPAENSFSLSEGSWWMPLPFLTVHDGSSLFVGEGTHFILCAPFSMTETLRPFDLPLLTALDSSQSVMEEFKSSWRLTLRELLPPGHSETLDSSIGDLLVPLVEQLHLRHHFNVLMTLLREEVSDLSVSLSSLPTEATRCTVVSLGVNFLAIFVPLPSTLDEGVARLCLHEELSVPLPEPISECKMSSVEVGRWLRWREEPTCLSVLDAALPLHDLIVVDASFDRLLSYILRIFGCNKHVLLTGAASSGRTTVVKRLERLLRSMGEEVEWVGRGSRRDHEAAQTFLSQLVLKAEGRKKVFVVVEGAAVDEPLVSLLQLLVERGQVVDEGRLEEATVAVAVRGREGEGEGGIEVILIGDEKWAEFRSFSSSFVHVPVWLPNEEMLEMIAEQLMGWHLHANAFSTEYHAMAERIARATVAVSTSSFTPFPPLPTLLRITKGLFFSSPDNSPDTESIIRLWTHEVLRVVGDPTGVGPRLAEFLSSLLSSILNAPLSLFDNFLPGRDGETAVTAYDLTSLLYSEIETIEAMEGLAYVPVVEMDSLLRAVQNTLFECSTLPIRVAVTTYIGHHWQRAVRVFRQCGEHLSLAGLPRSGRSSTLRLACFSLCMQMEEVWSERPSEWLPSFSAAIARLLPIVASSNHHVAVVFHADFTVLPPWVVEELREWAEKPQTTEGLPDHLLLSLAETLLEQEKALAGQMQTTGIRLPGQRLSRFISPDALKDVSLLRSLLVSRVQQFVHFVFLVPPSSIPRLPLASADCYEWEEDPSMEKSLLSSCPDTDGVHLLLRELLGVVASIVPSSLSSLISLSPQARTFHFFSSFARDYNERREKLTRTAENLKRALKIADDIHRMGTEGVGRTRDELVGLLSHAQQQLLDVQRRRNYMAVEVERAVAEVEGEREGKRGRRQISTLSAKGEKEAEELRRLEEEVEGAMEHPRAVYSSSVDAVVSVEWGEWKRLGTMAKPSVGVTLLASALHLILDGETPAKNSKTSLTSILNSQKTKLRISTVHAESLPPSRMAKIGAWVQNRELRPGRLQGESILAAALAQWLAALHSLATLHHENRVKHKAVIDLKEKQEIISEEIARMKAALNELVTEEKKLSWAEKEASMAISMDRKALEDAKRSECLTECLSPLLPHWEEALRLSHHSHSRLLADSSLYATFSSLLTLHSTTSRKRSLSSLQSVLTAHSLPWTEPCSTSRLMTRVLSGLRTRGRSPLLLFPPSSDPLPLLHSLWPRAISIDSSHLDWTSPSTSHRLEKLFFSSVPIILHSLSSSPPSSYWPLLSPSMGDRPFFSRLVDLPDDFLLVFVSSSTEGLHPQFLHLVEVVVVEEAVGEEELGRSAQGWGEDSVVSLLSTTSAEELLQSEEKSEELVAAVSAQAQFS